MLFNRIYSCLLMAGRGTRAWFIAMILLYANSGIAATITINVTDNANEGFNDTTAATPVGGNVGTTLGEQRLIVFEFAAHLLEQLFVSSQPIIIDAGFNNTLFCSSASATLGSSGPSTVHFDGNGGQPQNRLPVRNTYYVQALANSLKNTDQSATSDITMEFNGAIDNNNGCLNNRNWYNGLDGNPPGFDIDLLSVVLHEMLHGFGFITLSDLSTGQRLNGRDDIFMLSLEDHSLGQTWEQLTDAQRAASAIDDPDLHWIGSNVAAASGGLLAGINQGDVRMHGPSSLVLGSSVSHFSSSLSPFNLMEPTIASPVDNIGLAEQLLMDIGWTTNASAAPIIGPIAPVTILNANTTAVNFAIMDNDTSAAIIIASAVSSDTAIIDNSGILLNGAGRLRTLFITPEPGMSGPVDITVSIDDGTSTAQTTFQVNVVSNLPPDITITNPIDGDIFLSSQVNLSSTASDAEDGDISSAITWSSSIDGSIGNGSIIDPVLSDGSHLLTASVDDSDGNNRLASITITVSAFGDNDDDGLVNSVELLLGTDPDNSDSDNDFLTDFEEVSIDGDPSNYTEGIDSNPLIDDSDGDGLKDGLDLNPLIADPPEEFVPLLPQWALVAMALLLIGIASGWRKYRMQI